MNTDFNKFLYFLNLNFKQLLYISYVPKDELGKFHYFDSHHKVGEAFPPHTGNV